jgi:hypothetical protein
MVQAVRIRSADTLARVFEFLGQLLYDAVDALGLVGWISDRHRPWILRLFVTLFFMVVVVVVVAVVMVLTGHG